LRALWYIEAAHFDFVRKPKKPVARRRRAYNAPRFAVFVWRFTYNHELSNERPFPMSEVML
jgi:hypothetical protein